MADTHTERAQILVELVVEMPNDELAADERADEIAEFTRRVIAEAMGIGVYGESVKIIDWTSAPLKEGE